MITNFKNSDNYRSKIHNLIPGGAHTYSKGDDQFPLLSPAAISHGKGAYVWDIDGNKFLDCSMGLSSVSLGHAFDPINDRVKQEIDRGVNFQRPSYIEMEAAESFLSLVPAHDMIKFAKNGSLVTTAAVKLARAFTGRKLVAFPGDHPFYSYDDWFIGKTACNRGVPEEISNLSLTFKSCNLESLQALFDQFPNQIACVITEPEKNMCGADCNCSRTPAEFLREAIDLCHRHGALFIMDEMITGFKTDLPGCISKYDLKPDMATWGKGIANGFSFCALTGKKEIMELGGIRRNGEEKVFLVSTTHGAETSALAAAIATIDYFQQNNVVAHNQAIGDLLIAGIRSEVAKAALQSYIQVSSSNWMPIWIFRNREGEADANLRTLMMQEMIRRGILFQGAFIPCFSHTELDIEFLVKSFANCLNMYALALEKGTEGLLVGEPAKPVFRKYL